MKNKELTRKRISTLLLPALFCASCGGSASSRKTITVPPSTDGPAVVATPTYADNVKSLIDSNCVGCHDGGDAGNKIDLSTYDSVKAQAADIANLMKSTHHEISWKANTLTTFQNWISDGYLPGTASTATATSTSTNVTFAKDIVPMFSKCATCHVDNKWSPKLATYEDVKQHGGYAVQSMGARSTPHYSVTWGQEQVDLFNAWVQAGYPQ